MWRKTTILFLFTFSVLFTYAQRVLYSPFLGYEPGTRFEVIGKSGNYYWIQKSKKKFTRKKVAEPWMDDKELSFEIYDERMNLVKAIPSFLSEHLIKEYLVPGDKYFDQLVLQPANQKIIALLNRYSPDGSSINDKDTLCEFPAGMKCGDFLLVRSQDKSKILLLGFETVSESPPKLHAMLYDQNWKLIYHTDYININISKPLVQYDLLEYPLEDYNSTPLKVGNNGEWLMAVSSGTNRNYLLFHFKGTGEGFGYKEIRIPAIANVEDVGLYLDNERQQGFAGISSRIRTPAVKNIQIVHYSLNDFRIDFDTSYFFNTLAGNKMKNENVYEEYFMTVPGRGFLFLKEYGRPFSPDDDDRQFNKEDDQPDEMSNAYKNDAPETLNKDDYTRYDNLAGTRNNFDRGDLTLYYFPANPNDSCWSGIINKQQATELGTSYLSYVFLPKRGQTFFSL